MSQRIKITIDEAMEKANRKPSSSPAPMTKEEACRELGIQVFLVKSVDRDKLKQMRKAFALLYHPDRSKGTGEQLAKINAAIDTLLNK